MKFETIPAFMAPRLASFTLVGRVCLEFLLVILLAMLVGRSLWYFWSPAGTASATSSPAFGAPQVDLTSSGLADQDFSILTTQNPFFSGIEPTLTVPDLSIEIAPETSLNLKLKGTRALGDGQGVAYITLPDNSELVARIGDDILDQVTLREVYADRVTIVTRGTPETLYLRDLDRSGGGVVPYGTPIKSIPKQVSAPVEAEPKVLKRPVSPMEILRDVNFSMVYEDGIRTGYRLTTINESEILEAAGLASGDIITRVNSRPVAELQNIDLQAAFIAADEVDLDIKRNGREIRLSVKFFQGD